MFWGVSILQNKIENTRRSIHLLYSYYNDFIGNEIRDSKEITIALTHSNFNLFWFNNFVNNIIISDGGWVVPPWTANSSINIWDKEEKGNFWSDSNGSDDNEDGLGDVSYFIYGHNTDNYPLMVDANLTGFDSHGVIRIPIYARGIKMGVTKPGAEINIVRETHSTAIIDGYFGWITNQKEGIPTTLISKSTSE